MRGDLALVQTLLRNIARQAVTLLPHCESRGPQLAGAFTDAVDHRMSELGVSWLSHWQRHDQLAASNAFWHLAHLYAKPSFKWPQSEHFKLLSPTRTSVGFWVRVSPLPTDAC
jgi:hypothetical protein